MNRRVLIVSPRFPPSHAPDHQRIRMALFYFEKFGWQPHILAVRPEEVEATQDPLLTKTIPNHIPITRTNALPRQQTRKVGLGSLGVRSLPYLFQAGKALLTQQQFDLVFFSTTVFTSMVLGAWWHQRFRVPYVVDCQDPWRSDYYKKVNSSRPPGGHLKYELSQLEARWLEPQIMAHVGHVISVSPAYIPPLRARYSDLADENFTVLPFGASEQDFEILPSLQIQQTVFKENDGKQHWVYVGAVGQIMSLALRSLFLAIQHDRQQHPDRWQTIQLHFIGTSYAPQGRAIKTVEPIAQEYGIADLVEEQTDRVPYFEALKILVESDAILLIGSDDPGYTASKLYPCILAKKPILAIFHQQSSVVPILHQCRAGRAVTFKSGDSPEVLASQILPQLAWLQALPKQTQPDTNWEAFTPYTAHEMTRKLCEIFDQVLADSGGDRS